MWQSVQIEEIGARRKKLEPPRAVPLGVPLVVCTPTYTHPEVVEQAARAGKHILCEKPMALTLEGCRRIIDACAAAGVKLAIGHTLRFWGAFLTTRRLVEDGVIGGVDDADSVDGDYAIGVFRGELLFHQHVAAHLANHNVV